MTVEKYFVKWVRGKGIGEANSLDIITEKFLYFPLIVSFAKGGILQNG
jgi:hypothetical protein